MAIQAKDLIRCSLFSDIPIPRLEPLAVLCQEIAAEAGQVLYAEDSLIPGLHILTEGTIEIIKSDRAVIAQIEAGGFFGEITLLGRSVASTATLLAASPCRIQLLTLDAIESWMSEDSFLEAKFFRSLSSELCNRLQVTTDQLMKARG